MVEVYLIKIKEGLRYRTPFQLKKRLNIDGHFSLRVPKKGRPLSPKKT
jgi:hypothetical protein